MLKKKTARLLCLLLPLFFSKGLAASPPSDGYTLIENHAQLPIYTPSISQREIQKVRLDNGLEAYLISDPEARLSGALMSVKAGSWEDPEGYPGLAHFLEHMLFLGTKKYPNESEYGRYITEHGGQTNAFTSDPATSYLFTVQNDAFVEALTRFSSFFKEPLFNPSGVARELQAIDQEYAKNLERDDVRQIYVMKELANADHPFHRFNMGNSQSLSTVSRATLENWYQQHYSANLMRLFVYSSLPMEELREHVVEDFSDVPNTDRESFEIQKPAFSSAFGGQYIYIEPIKDSRTLTLVWELPPKFAKMSDTRPDKIVAHVLGDEGEKSLLAQLKREKLAESIACGGEKLGNDLFLLYLQVDLTNEGLRDLDQVITRCFQAIVNLKESGLPSYLFEELKQMATIKYQHQSKENEFTMLMEHGYQIHDEDLATYPEKTKIIQKFDRGGVLEMLDNLTPQQALFFIMAPSKLTGIKPDQKEKWLGVEYSLRKISKDSITRWKHAAANSEINLPPPNIFIPRDLKLLGKGTAQNKASVPHPKLLVDTEAFRVYFAQDSQYGVPKISWFVYIRTPQIAMDDPSKIVLGDLYVKFLKDALNKYSYRAKTAGIEYDIKREDNGIEIEIEGYSQNAPLLLEEILTTIDTLTPTSEKFKIFKDSLQRQYLNFAKESPFEQSVELFKSALYENFVTEKEKATAIQKVSFKKFQEDAPHLFDETFVEGILYGNMTEIQGRELTSKIQTTFNKGVYPKEKRKRSAVMVLPEDQGPYYLESRTQSQGNAVLLAVENDTFSFKERGAQQVLMQAIKDPFFSTLRTKQQTGYLVHSYPEEVERKLFNIFVVQSNTHDVRDLLSRFEAFIEGYLQETGKTELTEEQFNTIKNTLVKKLEEPAKNVKEMGRLLKTLAFDYDGDFRWIKKREESLETLGYQEFLAITKQFLGKSNKRRLAILLQGELPKGKAFSYSRARSLNVIRNLSDYEIRKNG